MEMCYFFYDGGTYFKNIRIDVRRLEYISHNVCNTPHTHTNPVKDIQYSPNPIAEVVCTTS
jgi:hypothetical protein